MKKKSSTKQFPTADEMDQYLEREDLGELFRTDGVVKRPAMHKINLDLPAWVVQQIDRLADRLGVARQPLLKIWIAERLKAEAV